MINFGRGTILLLGTVASWNCYAVDYFLDPKFSASQRYDSNLRMLIKPEQYNLISVFGPGIDAGYRRENSELKTNFTWNQMLYDNQSDLNFDERLFNLNYQRNLQQFKFDLAGSYNSQSSLTTEPELSGTRFITRTKQIRRNNLNISPTATYDFDERNNVSLNYLYNKTTYGKHANNSLSDYDYQQVTGTYGYLYSERDKFTASLSGSQYKMPMQKQNALIESSQASTTETFQLGWQHSFTEQLIASLSGGIRHTQSESTQRRGQYFVKANNTGQIFLIPASEFTTKTDGFGQVFNGYVQKNFERAMLNLGASQQLSPTTQGQQQQTQLTFSSSYSLSESWTTGINGNYSIYDLPDQNNSSLKRTYYSVSPTINWKWTQEINLGFSYTYRQQKYDSENVIREGDIVQLQFNYQPQINRQVK